MGHVLEILCKSSFSEPTYGLKVSFIIRPVCCCTKPQRYKPIDQMSENDLFLRVLLNALIVLIMIVSIFSIFKFLYLGLYLIYEYY